MDDSRLEIMYEFCKLLENDDIRKEVEEQLKGYSVIHFWDDRLVECYMKYDDEAVDNHFLLYQLTSADGKSCELYVYRYGLWIIKTSINKDDEIEFHRTFSRRKIAEKCSNGLIYSTINTSYVKKNSDNYKELILDSLEECRYTFTNETMAKLFEKFSSKELEKIGVSILVGMLFKAVNYDHGILGAASDFDSYFEAEMKRKYDGEKHIIDPYAVEIYLNDENVSSVFDAIDGFDKINRVYDLYRGIINTRNENDIDLIHAGLLSQDAYDLKSLKGITEKEDSIVGKPLDGVHVPSGYADYLKQLFSKYGYNGDLQLNRDSILNAITYHVPEIELTSKQEEYVESQTDIQMNEVVKNKPKSLLRKLFGRK